MYRNHNCGELTIKNVGEKVTLAGWVQKIRNLGSMKFIDLRDEFGITQIVISSESSITDEDLKNVSTECVIQVVGNVVERSNKNDKIPTGEIEIDAEKVEVLGKCKNVLPFEVNSDKVGDVREDLRLEYRFLDLRNDKLHQTILLRSDIIKTLRDKMDELGFKVSIKWPNDVVLSRKKICGILTEMGTNGTKIGYVLIGVGINVNLWEFPEEMQDKATSLAMESGQEYDRNQIIGLVMKHFEEDYERFIQTCDFENLLEEYHRILANLNQPVRVLNGADSFEGVSRGIDTKGELLVEKADGTVTKISAGEVSVRGLYSYV